MENISTILYVIAGILTLGEIATRWIIPAYRKNPANAKMIENLDSLWFAMAVALSVKAVFIENFTIPSGSMEDTLLVGDYILVKKYEYGYSLFNKTPRFLQFKKPQRGEILVFKGVEDPSKDLIKRCIGIPGDVIQLKNTDLYLNGVKQDELYVKHVMPAVMAIARDPYHLVNFGPVTVEPVHYFMMGDNRDDSYDSRYWGQLDEKNIKGMAWCIYWHSVNFHPDFSRMFKGIH
jgi:signal peptidase I